MPLMTTAIHDWTRKTASFNVESNQGYILGALAANCTATFPASPANKDMVAIAAPLDVSTYFCLLDFNGKTANGDASLYMSAGETMVLIYESTDGLWRIL
jgi:hypothetical protein